MLLWFGMGSESAWLTMASGEKVWRLSALVICGGLAYFGSLALLGFRLADFRQRGAS